ncbi:hypothetical protein [Nocardia sp. NPDC051832]|uniref:hypothetical protein n=1 Tax=Nocardia sp. NPDC051832 TaxID=3155673 RepID=UPI00341A2D6A
MLVARVLGPLEITRNGSPLDIGGPLPRRLLAALILAAASAWAAFRKLTVLVTASRPSMLPGHRSRPRQHRPGNSSSADR